MKVCCSLLNRLIDAILMSTHNAFNLQLWDVFQGTQERVRNSHGKRVISVRAIEVLSKYFNDKALRPKHWSSKSQVIFIGNKLALFLKANMSAVFFFVI